MELKRGLNSPEQKGAFFILNEKKRRANYQENHPLSLLFIACSILSIPFN